MDSSQPGIGESANYVFYTAASLPSTHRRTVWVLKLVVVLVCGVAVMLMSDANVGGLVAAAAGFWFATLWARGPARTTVT